VSTTALAGCLRPAGICSKLPVPGGHDRPFVLSRAVGRREGEEALKNTVLLGRGKSIREVPADDWLRAHEQIDMTERLSFMTSEHHRVRNTAVRNLPLNGGKPLALADLVDKTGLERSRVETILEELERKLFFLVRNDAGEVSWAYPLTTDRTPHRLHFSTGERLFGA